jgi:hypothetical protein
MMNMMDGSNDIFDDGEWLKKLVSLSLASTRG